LGAPDPFWLISVLPGLALIPIQNELARINAARGIGVGREARYSTINTVWLTLSALLWLLMIAGMMLPEAA
jgi:predicted metal-binding membrane protein